MSPADCERCDLVISLGQEFREVFGLGVGVLGDLFAAAEAVGDDDGLFIIADGREQDALAEGLGDFVFVVLEAEGAGHAAAAGVEEVDVGAGGVEEG